MALTKVTDSMLATPTDTDPMNNDIAILGFKVAANGSLAKYNLVDQTIDDFQDASGVDAGTSTGETRDATGKYYSGSSTTDTLTVFTSTGASTWVAPSGVSQVEVLVVGGGGGSMSTTSAGIASGGGGAGGIVHDTDFVVSGGTTYNLTVGTGGLPETTWGGGQQTNGVSSSFDDSASTLKLIGLGGGYGGTYNTSANSGGSGGGSGSASGSSSGASTQATFAGATSYGNGGGASGAAGGGAGGAGEAGNTDGSGYGGDGVLFSTFVAYGTDSSNVASTGSNGGWFGGGGGDGGGGIAGVGGGGTGVSSASVNNGLANTGGGAGGNYTGASNYPGATGGTGFVGLKYASPVYNDMTLISTTTTAQAAPTKGDIVFTYTNGAGTTTLGTDVTAEYSADGGSTWTSMTLGSEGTTGGHNIATAHDVTLTSTSGTSMAYRIKTLNQSASKTTRIQAVSLGWS